MLKEFRKNFFKKHKNLINTPGNLTFTVHPHDLQRVGRFALNFRGIWEGEEYKKLFKIQVVVDAEEKLLID